MDFRDTLRLYSTRLFPLMWSLCLWPLSVNAATEPTEPDLFDIPLSSLSDIVVVSPSRSASRLFDSPGVVSVMTQEDIRLFGANNLIELIERFPSATPLTSYVIQNNAVAVRGDLPNTNDTHLLILINGKPFRSGFTGSFNGVLLQTLPVESIERIEFVRGPGSVLYGSNAYSAVVNVITRQAQDDYIQLGGAWGSYNTKNAAIELGRVSEDFDLRINANTINTNGWNKPCA